LGDSYSTRPVKSPASTDHSPKVNTQKWARLTKADKTDISICGDYGSTGAFWILTYSLTLIFFFFSGILSSL